MKFHADNEHPRRDARYASAGDRKGRESQYNSRYNDVEDEERRYRRTRRRPSPSYDARDQSMRDERPRRREEKFRRRREWNGRYSDEQVSDDDIVAESRQDLYVHCLLVH